MTRPTINPNDVGDLVPMWAEGQNGWRPLVKDNTYNTQLKELIHKTPAIRKRWTAHRLPLGDNSFFSKNLSSADYMCAVQLTGNTVGVLKIAPVTGHCTLFLRLKRAEWLAWADKNKVDRTNTEYAFHKPLDAKLGATILRSARAFELGSTGVHHPWVLALFCTMSVNDWLDYVVEQDSRYDDPTNKIGNFSLVALPPLPVEFEQCLCIMGHSAAFVKDDDDLTLSDRADSQPLDRQWGNPVAGGLVLDSCAHLFAQGATRIGGWAAGNLFTETLPDLDKYTKYGKEVLDHLRSLAGAGTASAASTASASTAAAPAAAPAATAAPPAAAPAAASSALAPSGRHGSLLDSDSDSDDDDRAPPNPTTPPRPPTPPSPPAAPAAPKKRNRPAPRAQAPRKKKPASSDSDEDEAEDDNDSSNSDETSEEEDDDSSSDEGAAGGDGGASSASSSPVAVAVAAAVATASEPPSSSAAPAPPWPMSEPALLGVLAEMARPCCERLKKLKRSPGVGFKARHHNQINQDIQLLETATSPVAFLAAALNIVSTLADIQSDRFRGDAVLVRCSEAERLCGLATQAGEFVEGVRELLKDAHTSADPQ